MVVGVAVCTDAGIICTAAKKGKEEIFFPSNTSSKKKLLKDIKCNAPLITSTKTLFKKNVNPQVLNKITKKVQRIKYDVCTIVCES